MKIRAYAKINLTLDVTGQREDGFHLLDTVMQSVSLFDRLEVRISGGPGVRMRCAQPFIPVDERNSAVKAAALFLERIDRTGAGVEMELHKRIPSRAGLGGGSADAAAALWGLNLLFKSPLTQPELLSLSAKVGADVPFCLVGGTKRCTGVGEIITDAPKLPDCRLVLCKPAVGMSTPRAYAQLDRMPPARTRATPRILEALETGDLQAVSRQMYNRFDEALKLMRVREIKTIMTSAGAMNALMTGSGSAVYGVFDTQEKAESCMRLLEGKGELFLTRPVNAGLQVDH